MDIYLKNEKLKEDFHFPVNPINKLSDKKNRRFETLDIVDFGEVDILKKGKNIFPVSFETLFPAKYYPFCRYTDIPDAKATVEKIKKWMDQEEPHRLIITDHDYNELVTISDFQIDDVSGEIGDKYISITFRPYRELKIEELSIPEKSTTSANNKDISTTKKMIVKVKTSLNVRSGSGTNYSIIGSFKNGNEVDVIEIQNGWAKIKYSKSKDSTAYVSSKYLIDKPVSPSLNNRTNTQSKGNIHTVINRDTLYKIAKKFYGDGSKWNLIYDANKNTIGNNPDIIKVGQKLVIP